MRTQLKSIAKAALTRQLSILLNKDNRHLVKRFAKNVFTVLVILLIGGIGVQTITSCSSGDDPGDNPPSGNQLAGNPKYERMKERYKYYDPDDEQQRCQEGVVEEKCEVNGETIWYNPLTHGCRKGDSCVGDVCEWTYYEFGTIELCGSYLYISSPNGGERCQGGVFQRKCGDAWYNYETHYCDGEWDPITNTEIGLTVKARQRCGSKYIEKPDSDYERCNNGVVERRCFPDENWYNEDTHYCSYDFTSMTSTIKPIIERCGSEYIASDYERCNNGVVEEKCGAAIGSEVAWYNYITQSCDHMNGTVKAKLRCGG